MEGLERGLSDLILFPVPVGWIITLLPQWDPMPVVSVGTALVHIPTHILKIIKINLKTEARHGGACCNPGTSDRRQRQKDCHNSKPACFTW